MTPEALAVIREAVCAIGWIGIPLREFYAADPRRASFEIEGTGFLIGAQRIVTCAHVVGALLAMRRKRGGRPFATGVQFVFRRTADADVSTVFRPFSVLHVDERIDIAVLGLDGEGAGLPSPVQIVGPDGVPAVGQAVGLCGYAHGSVLLKRGKEIYRFGPVVQMGTVAALSPFDLARSDAVILDLVTGPAASGSPVFSFRT